MLIPSKSKGRRPLRGPYQISPETCIFPDPRRREKLIMTVIKFPIDVAYRHILCSKYQENCDYINQLASRIIPRYSCFRIVFRRPWGRLILMYGKLVIEIWYLNYSRAAEGLVQLQLWTIQAPVQAKLLANLVYFRAVNLLCWLRAHHWLEKTRVFWNAASVNWDMIPLAILEIISFQCFGFIALAILKLFFFYISFLKCHSVNL